VHIEPVKNGLTVTHSMSGPHPAKQFVFGSPAKMLTHLKRIQNTAWLHPMQDPAKRVVSSQDLGGIP
jgi:hypothetical protein